MADLAQFDQRIVAFAQRLLAATQAEFAHDRLELIERESLCLACCRRRAEQRRLPRLSLPQSFDDIAALVNNTRFS